MNNYKSNITKSGKIILIQNTDLQNISLYNVHKMTFNDTFCIFDLVDGTTIVLPKDLMAIKITI